MCLVKVVSRLSLVRVEVMCWYLGMNGSSVCSIELYSVCLCVNVCFCVDSVLFLKVFSFGVM